MSKWWTGVLLWLCCHQPHFASVSVSLFVYLVSSSDCCSTCIVSCQRLALKRLVKWQEFFGLTCASGATAGKLLLPFCDITKCTQLQQKWLLKVIHVLACFFLCAFLPLLPTDPTGPRTSSSPPPPPPHRQ